MTETKCCKPFSRNTTLLLVWSALMGFVLLSITANLIPLISNFNEDLNTYPVITPVLVLLPVAGWISDSLLGRYRAITFGNFLLTVAYLVILISFVMLQFLDNTSLCQIYIVRFWWWNILHKMPFVIDQMIGLS